MMPPDERSSNEPGPDAVDRAVDLFLRHRAGGDAPPGSTFPASALQDGGQAQALSRVERTWEAVGRHADSPELMVLREQALTRARCANARRWMLPGSTRRRWGAAASIAAAAVLFGALWQFSLPGFGPGFHRTDIGEQKLVELDDGSAVALDARTRLRVRYSADARIVEITEGQAQFTVAKDASRPFKVVAGEHIIVALGTEFTVEFVDREVHVAMLEGRVAVFPPPTSTTKARAVAEPIELTAGEALRVARDGRTSFVPKADLAAATAWRQGEVIFHDEPLAEAVSRLNRYSRVQLKVTDPALAALSISGLFAAGDTHAFARALQSYLPVEADYSDPDVIELNLKSSSEAM